MGFSFDADSDPENCLKNAVLDPNYDVYVDPDR